VERDLLEVLKDAVRTRQRNEDLDRSVGRAVRRRGLDFQAYIEIMSDLREVSEKNKISEEAAAKRFLAENEQGDYQDDS
jgi:hypothetical protein